MVGPLLRLLRRFAGNNRGVAAVEFALVLPPLIVLYFGTLEAAALYTADQRVTAIAGTIGDLVSRVDGTIATSTLNDYFQAAKGIMQPYPQTALRQMVSVLAVSPSGVATVKWSRTSDGSAARVANSTYPLGTASTAQINLLARTNGWLVASEVSYPYKPVLGVIFSATMQLNQTEYFLPRFAAEIKIN